MSTPEITQSMALARLEKLRAIIREAGLSAAALVPGPYITYLTGADFVLASRPLVMIIPVDGDLGVIIPTLEYPRIGENSPLPLSYFQYTDAQGAEIGFAKACEALKLSGKRIGVEGLKMRVLEGQLIQKYAPGSEIVNAEDALMWLRLRKDAQEVAAMRHAIAMSEAALDSILDEIRPGMTERQIATILQSALAAQGSKENAFEPHVMGGPNTALPHGATGDRAVQDGEFLLFDYGAKYGGYAADITRTFIIGKPSAELKRIYETVLAANLAGIKAAGPGVPCQEVDRAARKVITDAGYGEYFIHRTGHGLGMDVHEGPYMREGNEMRLEPGMIFTVEPGIYVPNVGGVRIEDDVIVTETGAETLTTYPKVLRSIGG